MCKLHSQGNWGINGLVLPGLKEKNIEKNTKAWIKLKGKASAEPSARVEKWWREIRMEKCQALGIPGLYLSRLQESGDVDVEMGCQ